MDEISIPRGENNKCLLLNKQLTAVDFQGGETFTLGAFQKSKVCKSMFVSTIIKDGFNIGCCSNCFRLSALLRFRN